MALEQYAAALGSFDGLDFRKAWPAVRDANKRGFWPAIGLLVEACVKARRARGERNKILNGRMVDGEYQPWGGSCRCQHCINKTRSHGFYRAPAEATDAR